MNKIKRFMIDEEDSDVYAVSLVDEPAIESSFMLLSKEKPKFINLETNEKHMIYGPALRPDFPIYRNDENGEYYIEFSKNCVEKLSQKFLKNNYQFNFSTDHKDIADGITVTESWLKTDMEKDKSVALGLDPQLPIGTWFIGAKVDNAELWEKVKTGGWKGFSIEAFCNLNEINFKKDMHNTKLEEIEVNDSFWSKLKSIFEDVLGQTKTVDEAVAEVEEEVKPVEPTEETVEETVEETPQEEPVVEVPTEEIVQEVVDTVEEVASDEQTKLDELQAIVDELQAKIDEKDAEIADLKKENQKLSKQPSAETVKVDASSQSNSPSWFDFASGSIHY